jgi:hypothetical protein
MSYRTHESNTLSYFIGCTKWTPGTKHRCIRINQNVSLEKLKEMFENDGRLTGAHVSLLNYLVIIITIQYIIF